MGKKVYRVELNLNKGRAEFYLAKDVWVKGKKAKVRKYLGSEEPKDQELEEFQKKFRYEIEMKVVRKKSSMSAATFTSDHLSQEQLRHLEEIRFMHRTMNQFLSVNEIAVYKEKFDTQYIQGTTYIEGNTLSLDEVHDLLYDSIVPQGKSLREINEVQNFIKVVSYSNNYNGRLSVDLIRKLHKLIMDNIDYESAGTFRRVDDIGIRGRDLALCPAIFIQERLEAEIGNYYQSLEKGCHPFEAAVVFHHAFEEIHPFTDGNGRVGREVFNFLLRKAQLPKLLFLGKDRESYLEALRHGDEEETGKMIQTFARLIIQQRFELLQETLKRLLADMGLTIRRPGAGGEIGEKPAIPGPAGKQGR